MSAEPFDPRALEAVAREAAPEPFRFLRSRVPRDFDGIEFFFGHPEHDREWWAVAVSAAGNVTAEDWAKAVTFNVGGLSTKTAVTA